MQLDTHTRVTGKKDAGEVGELMPNRRGCPSRFISKGTHLDTGH